jgi:hypothetical protein
MKCWSGDANGHLGMEPKLPTVRIRALSLVLAVVTMATATGLAQGLSAIWRAATEKELQGLLPARATVQKEHIETEMRTASGITDGHGRYIAAILLITAGYAADGKYSHLLVTQVPMQIGEVALKPGEYVLGWERQPDSLNVHIYDAATGALQGSTEARQIQGPVQIASIRIWPPQSRQRIQIGRFEMPYEFKR